MKILAIEKEVPGVAARQYAPHLKAEAKRVWHLYQAGFIRELYFRRDWNGAVLVLECSGTPHARRVLGSLPLVKRGLIAFDIIPLKAYSGFARLFAKPV